MEAGEGCETDHALESLLITGQAVADQSVARFLEIERSDPAWSCEHDSERACLIDRLHQIGHRREARALVHRWLLGYREQLSLTPTRSAARREHLWRCLADVVEHTADQSLLETFWNTLNTLRPEANEGADAALPLLGIPILNRYDLLQRLMASLDHPIETLAIVDNSGGDGDVGQQLQDLQAKGHPLIQRIAVARPFGNLGVAGSWNHILTSFPEAPVALLANNDVRFTPNALRTALSRIDQHSACFLPLLPGPLSFSAFLINHQAWNTLGLFDENFYPAYCEDIDYLERLASHPEVARLDLHELQRPMAESNGEQSATIRSNADFASFNRFSFQLNRLWLLSQRRHRHDVQGRWLRRWLSQWSH
jgi:hypothetical protein